MDFLMQHAETSDTTGDTKIVYRLCNSKNDQTYPWGFLSITKNKYLKNQKNFNKLQARLLEQTKTFDKLVKNQSKNLSKMLDELGSELKTTGYNKPFIVWFDEDVIISSMVSSHLVNNEEYNEKLITADTIFDGIIFRYTTYDDKGELGINTKSFAIDLVENARSLKKMN